MTLRIYQSGNLVRERDRGHAGSVMYYLKFGTKADRKRYPVQIPNDSTCYGYASIRHGVRYSY